MKRLLLFFSLLTLVTITSAKNIEFHGKLIPIGEYSSILTDSSNILNIKEVSLSEKFIKHDRKAPSLKGSSHSYWVKFTVTNNAVSPKILLNISYPTIDEVTLFQKNQDGQYDSLRLGEINPFSHRKYLHPDYIFDLNIAQNTTTTFYLKIRSIDDFQLPVYLGAEEKIFSQTNTHELLVGIYVGLMLVMILYNLFIYFTVKDKVYLYYVIYILSVLITQTCSEGLPFRYLWPNNTWLQQHSLFIFPSLTGITGVLFMFHFLSLNKKTLLYKIGCFLCFNYSVAILLMLLKSYNIAYKTVQINAMSVALYMLTTAIISSVKGNRPARFFLAAWSVFLIGILVFILRDIGVLPYNNFTSYTMQIGSGLEVVLLSFALADRINTYKKEKEHAQAAALKSAQENERIIREQNLMLEEKVTERTHELKESNDILSKTLDNLKQAQTQLVDQEKMASLGQLTAGIAHEINNPINFVTSNVKPLKRDIDLLIDLMNKIEVIGTTGLEAEQKTTEVNKLKAEYDYDYLIEEIRFLLKGINEGSTRTAEIVKGLRLFSRVDEDDIKMADINEGIDSTITIINNLLNGKISITKLYDELPQVECYPGKLNQVFLNLISNAAYAIKKKFNDEDGGEIKIKTFTEGPYLNIVFSDNGTGMDAATHKKLFEPFFTTKPVGEGTGLGLSIAYNTIKKHNGMITVKSELGTGTEFHIKIPISHSNI